MSARLAMLCGLLLFAPPLAGQRVHEVRLRHPGPDEFRFAPARLVVGASDVIEFKVEEGGPYLVGFEPSDFAPADRARLQQALPAGADGLRGPVLAGPGAAFRVRLPGLPAGTYRFVSVTHAAYRMQGELTVR